MAVQNPPEGYTAVTPYLHVRDLAAALAFYQKALGATVHVEMPGPDGKLMHAEMAIDKAIIMLGEENLEKGAPSPLSGNGPTASIMLYVADADSFYANAVAAGCTAVAPLTDMFWGDRFGGITDPFGHYWSIATHIEDVTPEQMQERMAAMPKG